MAFIPLRKCIFAQLHIQLNSIGMGSVPFSHADLAESIGNDREGAHVRLVRVRQAICNCANMQLRNRARDAQPGRRLPLSPDTTCSLSRIAYLRK